MAEINHLVGINASPEKIYKLLTTDSGLSQWWTNDASGAGDVGSLIKFRFNDTEIHFSVVQLVPHTLVRWKHSGSMPEGWMGTEILFQLTTGEGQTFVRFTHSHWQATSDFLAHCTTRWGAFLLSLKDLAETGVGKPFPHDIRVDHS